MMKLFVKGPGQKISNRNVKNAKKGGEPVISCFAFLHAAVLLVLFSYSAQAATLPAGFAEAQVAAGLTNPTAMAFAPDGRLFVCQQGGQQRVIKNGALLAAPFVTVSTDQSGERGLLGVAFDPNFAANRFVYIYYTVTTTPVHNRVSRFTANGDVAVAGSEVVILELNNLSSATNHNGGAIHFGPDGKLYIAVGENANPSNSQTLNNLLGKVLRINADGTIPSDNPFFNTATGMNRAIWTLGLRNPFTFAFQPGTGRMFINDVGQSAWEEINDGIAGSNYGWPTCEGSCSNANFRNPLFQYAHSGAAVTGCAIAGGAFYNPSVSQFPSDYVGKYFFADLCSGWIKRYDPASGAVADFASGIPQPVDLQLGPDGNLYYLARGNSSVFRIFFTGNQAPSIATHPSNQTVAEGRPATFTVTANGTAPLSYRWQRNNVDIAGANSASYTIQSVTLSDSGAQFRAVVTNSFGSATSNAATLTVTPNQPPTGSITAPAAGALYSAGDTVNYAGTGTDPETGDLPASAFTWQVDFHHDAHTHPFVPATSGSKSGTFNIPTTGETSADVWYRIHLTVRDAAGLTHSTFRDVLPRKATITLGANVAGLQLTLDGQPVTAPTQVVSVVGMTRTLGVVSPQMIGSLAYQFSSWSDAGAATHNIATPSLDTTYTANFSPLGPTIISEATSTRAIAFDPVMFMRDPFPLDGPAAFSADTRTRIIFFVLNLSLLAGENASAVTVDAEDAAHRHYAFRAESVMPVPGFEWMSQVTVRLSDDIGDVGDVLVRFTLRGASSNRVRLGIGHVGGGPPDDAGAQPTPVPLRN